VAKVSEYILVMGSYSDIVVAVGGLWYSVIAYNRDQFASSVAMRQNQSYQEKNYHVTWVAAVREEVRDIMQIFVGRMTNQMVVNTLIAGIAGGVLCEGQLEDDTLPFIKNAFYMSFTMAVLYLVMAMMLATKGITVAYNSGLKFLVEVVPDQLDSYTFNYMEQLKNYDNPVLASLRMKFTLPWNWKAPAEKFEKLKRGFDGHVRVEGIIANTDKDASERVNTVLRDLNPKHKELEPVAIRIKDDPPYVLLKMKLAQAQDVLDKTPQPKGKGAKEKFGQWNWKMAESDGTFTDSYFESLRGYQKMWKPFEESSMVCTVIGISCIGQGCAYFFLGKLSHHYTRWGLWVFPLIWVVLTVMVLADSFCGSPETQTASEQQPYFPIAGWDLVVAFISLSCLTLGPVLNIIAEQIPAGSGQGVLVILAFAAHAIFKLLFLRHVWFNNPTFAALGLGDQRDQHAQAPSNNPRGSQSAAHAVPCYIGSSSSVSLSDVELGQCGQLGRLHDDETVKDAHDARRSSNEILKHLLDDSSAGIIDKDNDSRRLMRSTHGLAAFGWLCLLLTKAVELVIAENGSWDSDVEVVQEFGNVATLQDKLFFQPKAMACRGDVIFVAESFRVFRLDDRGTAHRVACKVTRPIVDVSLFCDSLRGCFPIVLLQDPPEVRSCHNQESLSFGFDIANVQRIITYGSDVVLNASEHGDGIFGSSGMLLGTVFTLKDGTVTEHEWDQSEQQFQPQWQAAQHVEDLFDVVKIGGRRSLITFRQVDDDIGRRLIHVSSTEIGPFQNTDVTRNLRFKGEHLQGELRGACASSETSARVLLRHANIAETPMFRLYKFAV